MKAFRCGDVIPGCDASFCGADEDAVLTQVAEHARAGHALAEVPPELVGAVRAAIQDVPDLPETPHR